MPHEKGRHDAWLNLRSPVSVEYAERRPFGFGGTIHRMHVELKQGGDAGAAGGASKNEKRTCSGLLQVLYGPVPKRGLEPPRD